MNMRMSDILTELVLEHKAESNLNYESDFKVLEKKKFQNHGNHGVWWSCEYTVGDTKPKGRFHMHVDEFNISLRGFTLIGEQIQYPDGVWREKKNPRDWPRCIGMLGPIIKGLIEEHPNIRHFHFNPTGELQRRRYQSQALIQHILKYIGPDWSYKIDGRYTFYHRNHQDNPTNPSSTDSSST